MAAMDFPNSPATGDVFGSSGTLWRWDGSRWISTIGPAGPRGVVARSANITADLGPYVSLTDIPGLTATFTADPSRVYRTTIYGEWTSTVGGDIPAVYICDAAGATLARDAPRMAVANISHKSITQIIETGLSGVTTRKGRGSRAIGTGNCVWQSNPGFPSFLVVEDITYEAGYAGTNLPAQVGGIWRRAAALSIANASYVNVPWDTEIADSHGFLTPTTNTFTIPPDQGGIYAITSSCALGSSGAYHFMPNNSAHYIGSSTPDVASGWTTVNATVRMAAGDTFYFRCWQNSGATVNPTNFAYVEIWKVA